MRTGLVLGAGGAFGWAWHLGVLEVLDEQLALNVSSATQVLGTSAGSAISIAAASGATTSEVLDTILQPPDAATMAEMRRLRGELRKPSRWLRPMAPRLLLRPGPTAGARSFVGALPAGVFPTGSLRRFPAPTSWPNNLYITAVRLDDGSRVALSGADVGVDLHDALEASAAVPMMFKPKVIGGVGHIDGAVASATNTDLLLGQGLERVVISSPMTRPGRGPVRRRSRWQLRREIAALEAEGIEVIVAEPTQSAVDLAEGYPRANPTAGIELVNAARSITEAAIVKNQP